MELIEALEEKIVKLIGLVEKYKEENTQLSEKISTMESNIRGKEREIGEHNDLMKKVDLLSKEKADLLEERVLMKDTIEKILKNIDNVL